MIPRHRLCVDTRLSFPSYTVSFKGVLWTKRDESIQYFIRKTAKNYRKVWNYRHNFVQPECFVLFSLFNQWLTHEIYLETSWGAPTNRLRTIDLNLWVTLVSLLFCKVSNLFFRVVGGSRDVPANIGGAAPLIRLCNDVPGTLNPRWFGI